MNIVTSTQCLGFILRDTLVGKFAEFKVAARTRDFAVNIRFRYIPVLNPERIYVKLCCRGELDEGPPLAPQLTLRRC